MCKHTLTHTQTDKHYKLLLFTDKGTRQPAKSVERGKKKKKVIRIGTPIPYLFYSFFSVQFILSFRKLYTLLLPHSRLFR